MRRMAAASNDGCALRVSCCGFARYLSCGRWSRLQLVPRFCHRGAFAWRGIICRVWPFETAFASTLRQQIDARSSQRSNDSDQIEDEHPKQVSFFSDVPHPASVRFRRRLVEHNVDDVARISRTRIRSQPCIRLDSSPFRVLGAAHQTPHPRSISSCVNHSPFSAKHSVHFELRKGLPTSFLYCLA